MKYTVVPLVSDPDDNTSVIKVEQDGAEFFGVYAVGNGEAEDVWVNDFETQNAANLYVQHRLRMH